MGPHPPCRKLRPDRLPRLPGYSWLKYPKFGHAAATDYTARYIRYGMMTREEAIPIIKARDGKLDPLCVRDFCDFCGYTAE